MQTRLPTLPSLLNRKIYKTGQTRGADDDVIFQNRVGRNSTVLIPYPIWIKNFTKLIQRDLFENGYIVLISPREYFESSNIDSDLKKHQLSIGINALLFYESREQWNLYNPEKNNWESAQKRRAPLGGQYVARLPATTAAINGEKIIRGYTTTATKGAGIRLYEYASSQTIKDSRDQLEALFWFCRDAEEVAVENGMTLANIKIRKEAILEICKEKGLLELSKLIESRIINKNNKTICPLCLGELSGKGFFNRLSQAEGRVVLDLTVTEINLFHIQELRYDVFNHHPYNLGWGHHHCNVVTKDSGIASTLSWMSEILSRNIESGYVLPKKD